MSANVGEIAWVLTNNLVAAGHHHSDHWLDLISPTSDRRRH
jgi:hypothetical protein